MSASLCWSPPPSEGGRLSDELKYKLGRYLCDTDGTIGYPTQVTSADIEYLKGLKDCGIKDADKLIALIEKYGEINLRWEH